MSMQHVAGERGGLIAAFLRRRDLSLPSRSLFRRITRGRRIKPSCLVPMGTKPVSIALFDDETQAVRVTKALLLNTVVDGTRAPSAPVAPSPAPVRCGSFAYSPTTLRLLKEGSAAADSAMMRFLSSLAGREVWGLGVMNDATACMALTERFVLLLTTLSELLSTIEEEELVIDGRTGFAGPVDALIRDQMDIPPRALGEFSESLHRDVRLSLQERGEIAFAWGRLALIENRMTVKVNRRPPIAPRLGKRVVPVD